MKQMKTILRITVAIILYYLIWSFVLLKVDFRDWAVAQRLVFVSIVIASSGIIFLYKLLEEDKNT